MVKAPDVSFSDAFRVINYDTQIDALATRSRR